MAVYFDLLVVFDLITIFIACRPGYWRVLGGLEFGIARGIAFAPYCDLLWMETKNPILSEVCLIENTIYTTACIGI